MASPQQDKTFSSFIDDKLPLVIDQGSGIKSKTTIPGVAGVLSQEEKKGIILSKGGSSNTEGVSSDNGQVNKISSRVPRRSSDEVKVAVEAMKATMTQNPGESDERFNQRVKNAEGAKYRAKYFGLEPTRRGNRSNEELRLAREAFKAKMTQKPGETDEVFNQRVINNELRHYRNNLTKVNDNNTFRQKRSKQEILASIAEVKDANPQKLDETDERYEKRMAIKVRNG